MATDATGTPTPLGIPKYNTAADSPSGKGFNAAMDTIDGIITAKQLPAGVTDSAVIWNGSAWVSAKIANANVASNAGIVFTKLEARPLKPVDQSANRIIAWGSATAVDAGGGGIGVLVVTFAHGMGTTPLRVVTARTGGDAARMVVQGTSAGASNITVTWESADSGGRSSQTVVFDWMAVA